jgi:uncharacterized membrane protein
MSRNEFLDMLERSLGNMSPADKNDVLYDYKEHFNAGLSEGKTEEEICAALGDPRVIAKQYRVDYIVKQADENRTAGNIIKAVFAALSLGFLNLIFIIPIFAALVGALIGLYAAALGIGISGVALFFATLLQPFFTEWISMPDINEGVLVFTSFGLTGLGALFTIGDIYITKFFYIITIKYIKANIKIISK